MSDGVMESCCHHLGLVSGFSHPDQKPFTLWLVVFCQFRELRWLGKGPDKCQSQREARRGEGVVEKPF